MIPSFRHEVDENYALLGVYAASSGNSLPTFWGQPLRPTFKVQGIVTSRRFKAKKKRSSQANSSLSQFFGRA